MSAAHLAILVRTHAATYLAKGDAAMSPAMSTHALCQERPNAYPRPCMSFFFGGKTSDVAAICACSGPVTVAGQGVWARTGGAETRGEDANCPMQVEEEEEEEEPASQAAGRGSRTW